LRSNFRTYLFLASVLVILSFSVLVWEYETTPTVSLTSNSGIPYAEASSVSANSKDLVVNVSVVDSGAFQPTGGTITIVETGQTADLSVGKGSLYAVYPLSPVYLNLTHIGVKGEVKGYFYGAPSEIYFFSVCNLKLRVSINISSVQLHNGALFVNLSFSSPIPLVVNAFYNVSLSNDNAHTYVLNSIGQWNVGAEISAGNNWKVFEFNPNAHGSPTTWVYSSALSSVSTYTIYLPVSVTYAYPSGAINRTLLLIEVFKG